MLSVCSVLHIAVSLNNSVHAHTGFDFILKYFKLKTALNILPWDMCEARLHTAMPCDVPDLSFLLLFLF